MKLIIDIPDDRYRQIKDMPNAFGSDICKAIRNGIPYDEKPFKEEQQVQSLISKYQHDFVSSPIEVVKVGEPLSNSDEINKALEKGELYKQGFEDARKRFERPQGDLKSSEALKAYAREVLCGNNPTNSLLIRMFDEIIDNAPSVSPYKAIHDELHKGEEE